MQTKRAFYSHSKDKAVKLYAISHKINYREKRSSPWPLVSLWFISSALRGVAEIVLISPFWNHRTSFFTLIPDIHFKLESVKLFMLAHIWCPHLSFKQSLHQMHIQWVWTGCTYFLLPFQGEGGRPLPVLLLLLLLHLLPLHLLVPHRRGPERIMVGYTYFIPKRHPIIIQFSLHCKNSTSGNGST